MNRTADIHSNGDADRGILKKDVVILRIKQQQNTIKSLQDKCAEADAKRYALREMLNGRTQDSESTLALFKLKAQQIEKELRVLLAPRVVRRASRPADHATTGLSSATPPQQATCFNFNPAMPPPSMTSGPPNVRSLFPVTVRPAPNCSTNNIDLSPSNEFSDMHVDPSIALILSRFKTSIRSSAAQIITNQTQQQRSKFTQDSQNGKRIMSRVRLLESENEDLSCQSESGRLAVMNNLQALRRRFLDCNLLARQRRTEKLIEETETETEVCIGEIALLQQQLCIASTTIEVLSLALESTQPGRCAPLFARSRWPLPEAFELSPPSPPTQPPPPSLPTQTSEIAPCNLPVHSPKEDGNARKVEGEEQTAATMEAPSPPTDPPLLTQPSPTPAVVTNSRDPRLQRQRTPA